MSSDAAVLTLGQWLSPAFPIGAFAYSHGLETAIAEGQISSAATLQSWLEDVLAHGTGRNDCRLVRAAHEADDPAQINAIAIANAPSAERLLESRLQGAAFCKTVGAVQGIEMRDLLYPVALGNALKSLEIDLSLACAMALHAFTGNLVSAAIRAVPLGQTEGQRVLTALLPLCQMIAQDTEGETTDDLSSTAFLADIASMRHETLSPRIFRS